jgi:hypothetical protein
MFNDPRRKGWLSYRVPRRGTHLKRDCEAVEGSVEVSPKAQCYRRMELLQYWCTKLVKHPVSRFDEFVLPNCGTFTVRIIGETAALWDVEKLLTQRR